MVDIWSFEPPLYPPPRHPLRPCQRERLHPRRSCVTLLLPPRYQLKLIPPAPPLNQRPIGHLALKMVFAPNNSICFSPSSDPPPPLPTAFSGRHCCAPRVSILVRSRWDIAVSPRLTHCKVYLDQYCISHWKRGAVQSKKIDGGSAETVDRHEGQVWINRTVHRMAIGKTTCISSPTVGFTQRVHLARIRLFIL